MLRRDLCHLCGRHRLRCWRCLHSPRRLPVAAIALVAGLGAVAVRGGETPRELLKSGNEHYAQGSYDEALDAYNEVKTRPQDRIYADVLNNQAAAHFKLGQHDEARELWVRAASLKDAAFEAKARYNIGNCHYADALSALQMAGAAQGGRPMMGPSGKPIAGPGGQPALGPGGQPIGTLGGSPSAGPGAQPAPAPSGQPPGTSPGQPAASQPSAKAPPVNPIEALGHAIENYRDALRLDPSLTNARANLELAAQLKKKLEDQAKQQPQSQPSDNQQQDQQNKDQKSEKKQDQKGDQDQQNKDKSQQDKDKQDSQGQQDKQDRKQDQQQQDQKQQDQDQEKQQSEDQEKKDQQQNPTSQPEQDEAQQAQPTQAQPVNLSPTEAARLLQMIRDAEQRRRDALRAREAAKQKPVDKDW